MAQKSGSHINNRKSHGKTIMPKGVYCSFFGRNSVKNIYSDVKAMVTYQVLARK